MERSSHHEFIRVVKDSKTAVLCIHGIVGSPNHFKNIIPVLPDDWSIYCIMLDGHGKTVDDFSETSMEKWIQQVSKTCSDLCDAYENVIIIAHSMGTLLSLNESLKHSDKIKKMILFAVPLRVYVHPSMMSSSMKLLYDRVKDDDVLTLATRDACSVTLDKRLWKYLGWIPRYLELIELILKTRRIISKVEVPTYVFQSKNDELVASSSKEYLSDNENIYVETLNDSGHFYYSKNDEAYFLNKIQKILDI